MSHLEKMLIAVRDVLLPLTEKEVNNGNHVFGGLIFKKDTYEIVIAGSNRRVLNPLFHGEVDTLNRFFSLPEHPAPKDLVFFASHDPCPMCAASIAWAGFTEVWTLFDYEDVQDSFDMPIDLVMYRDLFKSEGVNLNNQFYKKYYMMQEINKSPDKDKLLKLLDEIRVAYEALPVQDFEYPV